jgi:hypothetical protein
VYSRIKTYCVCGTEVCTVVLKRTVFVELRCTVVLKQGLSFVLCEFYVWTVAIIRASLFHAHMHGAVAGEGGGWQTKELGSLVFFFELRLPDTLSHQPCDRYTMLCSYSFSLYLDVISPIRNNAFFINGSALELSVIAANKIICLLHKFSLWL